MKINFNLWSLGISGGTRTVFSLANGLVDRGHEVTITALGKGGNAKWFGQVKAELNVIQLPNRLRAARRFFGDWEFDWARALAEAIPDCDANIATYCETAYPTLYSDKGKPYYFIQHDEATFFNPFTYEWSRAKHSYQLPLQKLCVSHWLTELFNGTFVGNGVDLNKFKPVKNEGWLPYRIMVVHRGFNWKGRKLIEPTLEILKNWCYLKRGRRRKGISVQLVVPENATDGEMVDIYTHCDVLLFPSLKEGFGLPPLEAMATGLPVVTTPCSGVNEYAKHLENCIVVEKPTPENLAGAIIGLLENPKLRKKLRKGGFATALDHSFDMVVDRVEATLCA